MSSENHARVKLIASARPKSSASRTKQLGGTGSEGATKVDCQGQVLREILGLSLGSKDSWETPRKNKTGMILATGEVDT